MFSFFFATRFFSVINRAPGLKLVVQTLLSSLRPIGNIVLICCTFFIIFGILGVQVKLFAILSFFSQFLNCNDHFPFIFIDDNSCLRDHSITVVCYQPTKKKHNHHQIWNIMIFIFLLWFFSKIDGPKSRFAHNKTECLSDPRNTWINRKYNFDNLGQVCFCRRDISFFFFFFFFFFFLLFSQ